MTSKQLAATRQSRPDPILAAAACRYWVEGPTGTTSHPTLVAAEAYRKIHGGTVLAI